MLAATKFDEEIEWTYFYLWHHEGRRARHGASMIPQAREIIEHARAEGKTAQADAVQAVIEEILARPEHAFFETEKKQRAAEAATPAS